MATERINIRGLTKDSLIGWFGQFDKTARGVTTCFGGCCRSDQMARLMEDYYLIGLTQFNGFGHDMSSERGFSLKPSQILVRSSRVFVEKDQIPINIIISCIDPDYFHEENRLNEIEYAIDGLIPILALLGDEVDFIRFYERNKKRVNFCSS
jgi:hypothetical protein